MAKRPSRLAGIKSGNLTATLRQKTPDGKMPAPAPAEEKGRYAGKGGLSDRMSGKKAQKKRGRPRFFRSFLQRDQMTMRRTAMSLLPQ